MVGLNLPEESSLGKHFKSAIHVLRMEIAENTIESSQGGSKCQVFNNRLLC
jgi:hypothetical protein